MIDVLYLNSASFSGSTLMTFMLAAHPAIATVGELKATGIVNFERYRCSCGQGLRTCPFWRRVTAALAERGVHFDVEYFGTHFRFEIRGSLGDRVVRAPLRGPWFEALRGLALRKLPTASREFQGILERNRVLIETICEDRGSRVFLDASKEPNRLRYMIESCLWNVQPVHLVRDGRGVAHSFARRSLRRHPGRDRRKELRAQAIRWRRVNEACEQLMERIPAEARIRVRYEDLCREPAATLAPVLALVGERAVEVPDAYRSIEHHILGNVMRLHKDARVTLDERWKESLTPQELADFEDVAGEMNRRYGYM